MDSINIQNGLSNIDWKFDEPLPRLLDMWRVSVDVDYDSETFAQVHFNNPKDNDYAALRTLSGEGVIHTRNGEVITLTANTFITVKESELIRWYCKVPPWSFEWYSFEIDNDLQIAPNHLRSVIRTETERRMCEECFANIGSEFYNQARYAQYLFHSLFALWHIEDMHSSLREKNIEYILKYAIAELSINLTIPKIAEKLNMSEQTLRRVFVTNTGMSPKRYIEEKRLKTAFDLLEATTMTVKEIAEQCGFCDSCHLSRCFKKRFGCSPKDARVKDDR